MAGVKSMLQPRVSANNGSDQILVSACEVAKLSASGAKQSVDEILSRHAKRTFPHLPATLASDPSLVLLLLDAPNVLTTTALAAAFPELRSPAFAARVCIPQADPAHYSLMATEGRMLFNLRFQRLDAWLDANARLGLRVPIFFADYETSERRSPPFFFFFFFERLGATATANADGPAPN